MSWNIREVAKRAGLKPGALSTGKACCGKNVVLPTFTPSPNVVYNNTVTIAQRQEAVKIEAAITDLRERRSRNGKKSSEDGTSVIAPENTDGQQA